jgi:hypothetical protein
LVVSARSAVVFALRVSLVFVLAGLWVGFCASRFSAGCGARRAARAGFALLFLLLERVGLDWLKLSTSFSRACGERVSLSWFSGAR